MKSLSSLKCTINCPICNGRLCDANSHIKKHMEILLPQKFDAGDIFLKCYKCKQNVALLIS